MAGPEAHALRWCIRPCQVLVVACTVFSCGTCSCVQLFATPWTIAHLAPQSVEFSRHPKGKHVHTAYLSQCNATPLP